MIFYIIKKIYPTNLQINDVVYKLIFNKYTKVITRTIYNLIFVYVTFIFINIIIIIIIWRRIFRISYNILLNFMFTPYPSFSFDFLTVIYLYDVKKLCAHTSSNKCISVNFRNFSLYICYIPFPNTIYYIYFNILC